MRLFGLLTKKGVLLFFPSRVVKIVSDNLGQQFNLNSRRDGRNTRVLSVGKLLGEKWVIKFWFIEEN